MRWHQQQQISDRVFWAVSDSNERKVLKYYSEAREILEVAVPDSVPPILDYGEQKAGENWAYIVMEPWGPSLGAVLNWMNLHRHGEPRQQRIGSWLIQLGRDILNLLQVLDDAGYGHLALRPEHLLLGLKEPNWKRDWEDQQKVPPTENIRICGCSALWKTGTQAPESIDEFPVWNQTVVALWAEIMLSSAKVLDNNFDELTHASSLLPSHLRELLKQASDANPNDRPSLSDCLRRWVPEPPTVDEPPVPNRLSSWVVHHSKARVVGLVAATLVGVAAGQLVSTLLFR